MLYVLAKVLVCFLLVYSIKYLKRKLSGLELMAYYLLTTSVTVIVNNIVSLNLELFTIKQNFHSILAGLLDRIIIMPFGLLWLVFVWRTLGNRNVFQLFAVFGWGIFFISILYLNEVMGVTKFNGWNAFIGIVQAAFTYFSLIMFYYVFHYLLKEDSI